MFCRHLLFLLILSTSVFQSWAQVPYHYFNSIEPHIAPGQNTKKIVQDDDGYLYFLYPDKVMKYNGTSFVDLSHFDKDRTIPWHSIKNIYPINNKRLLLLDKANKIYIVNEHYRSVVDFNPRKENNNYHAICYIAGKVALLSATSIELYSFISGNKLELDKSWQIDKASQLLPNNDTLYISASEELYIIEVNNESLDVFEAPKGRLYLDHNNQVKIFDDTNKLWTVSGEISLDSWQPFGQVKHKLNIAYTLDGSIWATRLTKGTYYASSKMSAISIDNQNSSLISSTFMRAPFCDKFGTLWIPSERLYYKPLSHGFKTAKLNSDKVVVNAVFEDEDYLMHSVQDDGLFIFDKTTKTTRHLTTTNSKLGGNTRVIISSISKGKYAINYFGGVQLFDGQNFSDPIKLNGTSRDFMVLTSGYVTSDFRSIYFLDSNFKISKSFNLNDFASIERKIVNKLIKLGKDKGYAMTSSGLILDLDISNQTCKILNDGSELSTFYEKATNVIDATIDYHHGYIALASSAGLYRYNLTDGSLVDSITAPGTMTGIESFKGQVWVSCQNGMYMYDEDSLKWKGYTKGHGLMNNAYDIRSTYVYNDSILLVGGYDGIDIVDSLVDGITIAPYLNVCTVQEFPTHQWINKDENDSYYISPKTEQIAVRVEGIHTAFGKDLMIEYRHSENADWQLLANGILNIIDPKVGEMHFSFRARLPSGLTSQQASIHLIVQPLWHQYTWVRWLAFLLSMMAFGGIVYWWQRTRYSQVMLEKKLQQEVLTYKLQSINSQMNPHFVFNVMSGIQQLILANENKIAMKYLNTFSRLLRHVVNYSSKNFVPISEELVFIKHYLELEKMRFEDKFDYKIIKNLPSDQEVLVPTFVIQPLLENSIKHGLKRITSNGLVTLKIAQKGSEIIVEVKDNGVGLKEIDADEIFNPSQPHGLQLVKNKLHHITASYGDASLTLTQGDPGVVSTIILPFIIKEKS